MKWLKDEEFIRGTIPMTKFEARVLIMAMLELSEGDVLLDIGAGTGSVGIQASLLGARVYALEKEREGIELIQKNADKFGTSIEVIHAEAPAGIPAVLVVNKCFVGGSSGKLEQIMEHAHEKLVIGGILAGSFIIPDNMVDFKRMLAQLNYTEIECRLIQASKSDGLGLMKANNPIYIIKGKKQ